MRITFRHLPVATLAALLLGLPVLGAEQNAPRLFPAELSAAEWTEFAADGYVGNVAGVIYTGAKPAECGMPLGGVATGCLDLETSGELGYCTIFNSLLPRRGPLNLPFLGMKVGDKSWILSTRSLPGMSAARDIEYWGHYPVADLEYDLDAPVDVSLRAWSPFIPGDVVDSNIPAAVFEVRLRNPGDQAQHGMLAMSFPGQGKNESPVGGVVREAFEQPRISGLVSRRADGPQSCFLGVLGQRPSRTGRGLGADASRWRGIGSGLPSYPAVDHADASISVAVDFALQPGEAKTVRFLLAWFAPTWNGRGNANGTGNNFDHMYARQFSSLTEVVGKMAENHESLLRRVLAWQQVVYADPALPPWLQDTLINSLHLITETAVWAQSQPPIGKWCRPEDGVFGMNESPRACPQMECIPCTFYGNLPIVYFFPELALSNLRAHNAYQFPNGRPAWVFGAPYEMASPTEGYQQSLNGSCYAEIFNKLWLARGKDPVLLDEFYDSLKKATTYTMTMRPEYGLKQVVSMPTGNVGDTWHESTQFYGFVTQIAGVHLAHLQMARQWAQAKGDTEWLKQLDEMSKAGSAAAEENLWNGKHYRLYNEPESGKLSDVSMGYQLDGEWISRFHGLGGVFDPARVERTLDYLKTNNADPQRWPHGVLVFAKNAGGPVGDEFNPGYWTKTGTHSPAGLMLGMTYLYRGQKDFGLDVCRRIMSNIICEQRHGWDWGILFDAVTGQRVYGNDYYQDLILWSLPAALAGESIAGPMAKDGLVTRMLQAGAAPAGSKTAQLLATSLEVTGEQGRGGWTCGYLQWDNAAANQSNGAGVFRTDGLVWLPAIGRGAWDLGAVDPSRPAFVVDCGGLTLNSSSGPPVRWAARHWTSNRDVRVKIAGRYSQNGGGSDGARLLIHVLRGDDRREVWSRTLPKEAVPQTPHETPPVELRKGDVVEWTVDPLADSAGNWIDWLGRITIAD